MKQKERCILYTLHSNTISHVSVHLLQHSEIKAVQLASEQIYRRKIKNMSVCVGRDEERIQVVMNLQMAFDMRYGESSHSHQLQNSLRRSLCSHRFRARGMLRKIDEENRSKKMIKLAGKACTYCPVPRACGWRGRSSGADRASI